MWEITLSGQAVLYEAIWLRFRYVNCERLCSIVPAGEGSGNERCGDDIAA
jgi:hypothetical protein